MSANNRKPRRQFSADTKLQILKEGRHTNLNISQVCEQYQISPALFYQWERQADQAALKALNNQGRGRKKVRPAEEQLLAEVQRLPAVIAELSAENLQLKGALAITPGRRYTADEKASILATITYAQQLCPERSLTAILADRGVPLATDYRWQDRAERQQLADRVVVPSHPALPPTPQEIAGVVQGAQRLLLLGYKRLAYALMAENKAFLRPWMVRDILDQHQLLGRRAPVPEPLVRPLAADHPDQRWHTDLTMWWFDDQWFWMIDILDAYSRYLVHCELLLTAKTDAVERAVQRALDTLAGRPRLVGEPQIVHDGGPQFVGPDWVQFMHAVGATDVRTHPGHPQSNGLDERVPRTFREELPIESEAVLYEARTMMFDYRHYYNHHRPPSALKYLGPIDYYRGDPVARLAERETKLRTAAAARAVYWQQHRDQTAESLS